MYPKTNTLALIGVLAATGAMAQYSTYPASVSTEEPTTSSMMMTHPAGMMEPPKPTTTAAAAYVGNNSSALSVWSSFPVTVPTTIVVNQITTTCHAATTITHDGHTYPATAGQVVTITNCPCTVTTAVAIMTSSLCAVETGKASPPPPVKVTYTSAPVSAPTKPMTLPPPVQVGGAAAIEGGVAGLVVAAVAGAVALF